MSTVRAAIQNLRKNFWPLLWVQLPAASINPLQDLCEAWTDANPFWGALIFIPYLFLTSYLSSAGTFWVLEKQTNWKAALGTAFGQWRSLFAASLATGLIILLGFAAILLPGIFFAAIYLFVPYLIMEESGLPLSVYMHRSKKLAQRHLLKTCGLVVGIIAIMTWSYFLGAALGKLLFPSTLGVMVHRGGILLIHLVLAIVLGAVIDVFVCHYYFDLRRKANE
ncbi:MAG: hypothetical protein KDD51_01720 [Bdellovibrionales bacterium]|nr:hypothetical protein [Bdellovibrionales bacterium]